MCYNGMVICGNRNQREGFTVARIVAEVKVKYQKLFPLLGPK